MPSSGQALTCQALIVFIFVVKLALSFFFFFFTLVGGLEFLVWWVGCSRFGLVGSVWKVSFGRFA